MQLARDQEYVGGKDVNSIQGMMMNDYAAADVQEHIFNPWTARQDGDHYTTPWYLSVLMLNEAFTFAWIYRNTELPLSYTVTYSLALYGTESTVLDRNRSLFNERQQPQKMLQFRWW